MAAAHCATAAATSSFYFPPARKPILVCSMSTRTPSRLTKRKNYLRPKFLKTPTKPFFHPILPELTPANPLIPLESSHEQQQSEFTSEEFTSDVVKEFDQFEQQPPELSSDQFSGKEINESDLDEQEVEVLSNQLAGEEVKNLNSIDVQPKFPSCQHPLEQQSDFPSDQFPVEEIKEFDPVGKQPELLSDQFPGVEMEFDPIQQHSELPSDQFPSEEMKEFDSSEQKTLVSQKIEESEVSEFSFSATKSSAEPVNGVAGNIFSTTMFHVGLGFVGACVINVIWSTWMAKSIKSEKKYYGNLGSVAGVDGYNKPKSELSLKEKGNSVEVIFVDESAIDKKIAEIQELAREAREKEKFESKENGSKKDDDDDDVFESEIKKVVDDGLIKVRKSMKNSSKKSSMSPLWDKFWRNDEEIADAFDKAGLVAEEASEALMFKKKHRFKGRVIDAKDTKPKGFMGRRDRDVTQMETNGTLKNGSGDGNEVDLLDRGEQLDLPKTDELGSVSVSLEEDKGRKLPAEDTKHIQGSRKKWVKERARTKRTVTKSKQSTGIPQRKSISLEAQGFRDFTPKNQHATHASKKRDELNGNGGLKSKEIGIEKANNRLGEKSYTKTDDLNGNGGLKSKEVGIEKVNNRLGEKSYTKTDDLNGNGGLKSKEVGIEKANNRLGEKSYTKTDFWWLSLPYVLAIVMRRGHGSGGSEGLFTLRSSSQDTGVSTCTIAFEDRADATNACHILESFFEELGDFGAEIVPIPIKELEEAIKSQAMKILVVKKGQVQLYAGQSLTDVETALHSLVGQS